LYRVLKSNDELVKSTIILSWAQGDKEEGEDNSSDIYNKNKADFLRFK